jgi:OmpA-OmpF porin, OOP family
MLKWLSLLLLCASGLVMADATIPKADLAKAKDSPLIGRFAGSFIVSYEAKDYDEMSLVLGPLKVIPNKRDEHNNDVVEAPQVKRLEGRRTRLVYLIPANTSPLQVLRNYQAEVSGKEGKTLYECKAPDCGGDATRSYDGGGGVQSLGMFVWSPSRIKEEHFTNGHCAQTMLTGEQRYAAMELPKNNAYVSVHAYTVKNNVYCDAFNGRTIAVVDVLELKAMAQKMVSVKAEEMAQAINTHGRVALYGLFFDSGKADVKPESKDTLDQIARLLTSSPAMNLLVVGHTDNVGGFPGNLELSKRRAEAVIQALTSQYKIDRKRLTPFCVSSASPVATNSSEDGKAKNRRVELVPN